VGVGSIDQVIPVVRQDGSHSNPPSASKWGMRQLTNYKNKPGACKTDHPAFEGSGGNHL
jgi:hypothetical protein